jgi:hypothetical protein
MQRVFHHPPGGSVRSPLDTPMETLDHPSIPSIVSDKLSLLEYVYSNRARTERFARQWCKRRNFLPDADFLENVANSVALQLWKISDRPVSRGRAESLYRSMVQNACAREVAGRSSSYRLGRVLKWIAALVLSFIGTSIVKSMVNILVDLSQVYLA